jgi:hypothetical protein
MRRSNTCGHFYFRYPWWCSREVHHYGPCALHWKPWRFFS